MVSTAARVGSINVLLAVQFGQATAGLNTFAGTVERTGQRTQRAVAGIDRSVIGMNRALSSINARGFTGVAVGALRARDAVDQLRGLALAAGVAMGGLVPAAIAANMVRTADKAHLLSNQLRTVTSDADDLRNAQEALFQLAQRSRAAFDSTVTIYARTARATEHLGLSQEKLLRITETVQKAFAVGGASAAEATGAAIQLSQGIASDRFSGEEFRSVAENAPVLLKGMADALGVNIGRLREMAHAGELTAAVVTQAILDASDAIEADFAKTTSTIEQAWTKVGNAVIKYTMDAEGAAVASNAIVTVLNALSSNIDTTADAILMLGGAFLAAFAGRGLNAIRQNNAAMGANLALARQNAAFSLNAARAEAAANAQRLASAKAYYSMVTQGAATEATRVGAARELHKANIANLASQKALAIATAQHDAALKAASISGRTFAAAGRAASAAWAFIGGPFGAALLAIGGIMYLAQKSAADAQAMTDEYAEAIKKAGEESDGAAGGIRRASEELTKASHAAGAAATSLSIATAQSQFETSIERMRMLTQGLRSAVDVAIGFNSMSFSPIAAEVSKLVDRFEAGELSAEELRAELDRLAREDPDNSAILARLQEIGDGADAARGKIDALRVTMQEALGELGKIYSDFYNGKGDRVGSGPFGGGGSDILDTINLARRMNPELLDEPLADRVKPRRERAPRKTADDRIDNSLQRVRDRIAAMAEEQAALSLTYREQERRRIALELEQEALEKVREEARRKGEVDWQNAQLAPEQIAEIDAVSQAYAAQADALRIATERQEFQRDIIMGVMNDVRSALDDGKITTEEWGDIFIGVLDKIIDKLLNDLLDALFQVNNASGGGGGGGILGSLLGGLFGGGFAASDYALAYGSVGLFHGGGSAGSPKAFRSVPMVAPSSLPKMHGGDGLKHNELMAVLEDTENVITGGQTNRIANALKASASIADAGPRAYNDNRTYHIDARGAQRGVGEEIRQAIEEYDRKTLPFRIREINDDPRAVG